MIISVYNNLIIVILCIHSVYRIRVAIRLARASLRTGHRRRGRLILSIMIIMIILILLRLIMIMIMIIMIIIITMIIILMIITICMIIRFIVTLNT